MNAKKLLLALLALVVACSMVLVGCDSADNDDKNDDSAASSASSESSSASSESSEESEAAIDLTGSWEAELDIGGLLTEAIAASLNAEVETIEFKAAITFEFDGSEAVMKMAAKEDNEKVVDIMLELAYKMVLDQGVEMTYEQYLELVEQENLRPDLETQADQVIASLETESEVGEYTIEGNVIKFNDGTFDIEYKGDSFTIKKINMDDADDLDDMSKEVFKLLEGATYKKVK